MYDTKIDRILQKAFGLRLEGKYSQSKAMYDEITEILNFSPLEFSLDFNIGQTPQTTILNYLSLGKSLIRLEKGNDFVAALDELIEAFRSIHHIPPTFIYLFEKGIYHYYNRNYLESIHYFGESEKLTDHHFFKKMSSLNEIISESLIGIINENKIHAFIIFLSNDPFFKSHVDYLQSLMVKGKFLRGVFDVKYENMQDAAYFTSLYIDRLPYSRGTKEDVRLNSFNNILNFSFSIETVQFIDNEHSYKKIEKVSDLIDRMYLWTWYYLAQPQSYDVSMVLKVFNYIKNFETIRVDYIDSLMFKNSILWLVSRGDLQVEELNILDRVETNKKYYSPPNILEVESYILEKNPRINFHPLKHKAKLFNSYLSTENQFNSDLYV